MNHGSPPVEPVHLSADKNRFADRQRMFQPALAGMKEGEGDFSRFIVGKHPVRGIAARIGRWLMAVHEKFECYDGMFCGMGNTGLVAPVDQPVRRHQQQVYGSGVIRIFPPQCACNQRGNLRADAGKGDYGYKQRI